MALNRRLVRDKRESCDTKSAFFIFQRLKIEINILGSGPEINLEPIVIS